jgi:hypothetical protein
MNQPSIPEPEQQESEPKEENPVDERLVKQWNLLMPAVTWVMAMIGSFWLPAPPGLITEDTKVMVSFAKYLATISTGIMVLPILKWSSRKHVWLWGKVAAIASVLSVAAFFSYQQLEETWTVKHDGELIYIGGVVKQEVAEFIRVYHPSKEELLDSAGWDPARVWTQESIQHHRLMLSAVYVLGIPLFVIT